MHNVTVGRRKNRRGHPPALMHCTQCGCTNTDACHHPVHGPCYWWNGECTLCSHCALGLTCPPRASQLEVAR